MTRSDDGYREFDQIVVMFLGPVYRRALRPGRPVIGTDAALVGLSQAVPEVREYLLPIASPRVLRHACRAGAEAESVTGARAQATGSSATVRALREAQWIGASSPFRRARPDDPYPVWSPRLLATLDAAQAGPGVAGTHLIGPAQVLTHLVDHPDGAANRLLARYDLDPEVLRDRLRRAGDGPAAYHTPALIDLAAYGARPAAVPWLLRWPARLLAAAAQKGTGGHGPLVPVLEDEAERQAFCRGDRTVEPVHLLLSVASLHLQLRSAQVELPEPYAGLLRGGAVLARHGAGYPALVGATVKAAAVGPPAPLSVPKSTAATAMLDRANTDATARGDAGTGSTHLLRALVDVGDLVVEEVLAGLAVDRAALSRDLDPS